MGKISTSLLEQIEIVSPNLAKMSLTELNDLYTKLHEEWKTYNDANPPKDEDEEENEETRTQPRSVVEEVEITARDSTGKIQRYRKMTQER